jgi:hypothetical protein
MRAQIRFSMLVCVVLLHILACRGGEAPPASPLPTSTESLFLEMMQVAKEEASLLETFWTDEDVRNGRARWAILKNRMQDAHRALEKQPEPHEKEKRRLIEKYGPEADQCKRRVDAVEKRLPLVAKVHEELMEESLKASVDKPASAKPEGPAKQPDTTSSPKPPPVPPPDRPSSGQ